MTLRPQLIVLETQPDFPGCDLTENNATYIKNLLTHEPGLEAHAEQLQAMQRPIHHLATWALRTQHVQIDYSPAEYKAFSRGFTDFEIISDLVTPPVAYDTAHAASRAQRLFIDNEAIADFEIGGRIAVWPEQRPNTYDTIVALGTLRDESMKQLHARIAGAVIAFELQRPALDVAS